MANRQHLEIITQGAKTWNRWRETSSEKTPDLGGANLRGMDLRNVDLSWVNLMEANLRDSNLYWANLRRANLRKADLRRTLLRETDLSWANLGWANLKESYLRRANLRKAELSWANLKEAFLREADLRETNLRHADLRSANLREADLKDADLREAYLSNAELTETDLEGADLRDADLRGSHLLKTSLKGANLSGCHIYGISAWELGIDETTKQDNLIISDWDEPTISIDDFNVAQFMYLFLHTPQIPRIFDTVTSQLALILGRFPLDRQPVLEALRDALRRHQYVPILLDFQKPNHKNFGNMLSILVHLVRFIITDFTQSQNILQAIPHIIRHTTVPFQPLLSVGKETEPPILLTLRKHHTTVLETLKYVDPEELAESFDLKIMKPVELKLRELQAKR